jgi:rhodanese-related sulfurtransferase
MDVHREVAVGWLQKMLGGDQGIGPKEADGLVRSGAVLLDVREPTEWQAGHAPGPRHVPLGDLEDKLAALPRDRRVVVVCRSGNRSARATALLLRSGFEAVNLSGGMRAWAAAGLPVETKNARPGTVV